MDWQMGRVDHASLRAYRIDSDTVFLEGMSQLPTPGYETAFRPYKMPHAYEFCWREKPGTWPDVVTPRSIAWRLSSESGDVITVTDQNGKRAVNVESVTPEQRRALVARGDGNQSAATGWSSKLDFDEALREAVRNLQMITCDELVCFRIVETGGVVGGIAGQQDLYISIERSSEPAPERETPEREAANR